MGRTDRRRLLPAVALGVGAAALAAVAADTRVARAAQPLTDGWRRVPVAPRRGTLLGISFRPRQVDTFGLDPREALGTLLKYPFEVIRLGAYWSQIEAVPGTFDFTELDFQVEAAERAGKRIILSAGAVKTFGYPEYFVPGHRLHDALPEGTLIRADGHRQLLTDACEFLARVVRRYRDRAAVVAWQVEHEAVDPLGMEHSWRLSREFVREELAAVRTADPDRPVLLNGFLPTSLPVRAQQWWRTRDQGDSLAVALDLADIVGIDFYPRHALFGIAGRSVYLAGSANPWSRRRLRAVADRAARNGRRYMVSEGQAEPWEAVTTPPDIRDHAMYSCLPEHVITNYNACMRLGDARPYGYLFWGAEYWLLRAQGGDRSYLGAFARVLAES